MHDAVIATEPLLRGFSMDLSLAKCIAGRAVGVSRALHCVHSPRVQLQLQFLLQFSQRCFCSEFCAACFCLIYWLGCGNLFANLTKTSITHALSKNTAPKNIKRLWKKVENCASFIFGFSFSDCSKYLWNKLYFVGTKDLHCCVRPVKRKVHKHTLSGSLEKISCHT